MGELSSLSGVSFLFMGTLLGIVVGAIPGLTGAMLIALSLPFTFQLSGSHALILLVSMYVGAVSGGMISATVLRIPGTPAAMITTLDGYPMAISGRGKRALSLGIWASFMGGMVSFLFLICLAKPLAAASTHLGPFESFGLVLMALVLLAVVEGRQFSLGILGGVMGMLCSIPGMSPATGELRWTLGWAPMSDGFKLLPVLIGLFAINGVFRELFQRKGGAEVARLGDSGEGIHRRDFGQHGWNGLRSAVIGTGIGILPGIGANVGSAVAYGVAKRFARNPGEFGRGSEEGVIASESANNATVGGALIPLIALGIPGSVIDAILLGALIIHGLQPGPLLFTHHPAIVHVVMVTYLLANGVMLGLMLIGARRMAALGEIPRWVLLPTILLFCVIGSYSLGHRIFDVWVMVGFGVLGWGMERLSIPLAPFVIGFVLAPLAEENLSAGLMASGGSWAPLLTRPLSCLFILISLVGAGTALWKARRRGTIKLGDPPAKE